MSNTSHEFAPIVVAGCGCAWCKADAAMQAARDERLAKSEPVEAFGTMFTHIDCPYCEEVFDLEGDRDSETVECPSCNTTLKVRRI